MRGAITCLCLLMLLVPVVLSAGEPAPQPAPGSTEAPAVCPAPQAQQAQAFSENWCGAPCSPNGAWGECIGYDGCGWLHIGDCRCLNAHWYCVWPC